MWWRRERREESQEEKGNDDDDDDDDEDEDEWSVEEFEAPFVEDEGIVEVGWIKERSSGYSQANLYNHSIIHSINLLKTLNGFSRNTNQLIFHLASNQLG